MADNLTPAQRSDTMRRVKGKDTAPELQVRSLCRLIGATGYRLHRTDIPGTPDLVFIGQRKAIFIHGCFWHGHSCKAGAKRAQTNAEYWDQKIARTVLRDSQNQAILSRNGWDTLVLWECELKARDSVLTRLRRFLGRYTSN